jgi:Reverse transcriptase (RNA-dependent DNA polymerase)
LRPTERTTVENCVDYFAAKVDSIKSAITRLLNGDTAQPKTADAIYVGQPLAELSVPSVDEVTRLINAMPTKSSPADTIPISITKSCADMFAPLIKGLVELSFNESVFPACYKTASVTQLLKNYLTKTLSPSTDQSLSFIGYQRSSTGWLCHASARMSSSLHPSTTCIQPTDAATRARPRCYSWPMTYCASDTKSRTLFVQLDLWAAFYTIDQHTLLRHLDRSFTVTVWVYSSHSQFVRVGRSHSAMMKCDYGMPQGWVLGLLLFHSMLPRLLTS